MELNSQNDILEAIKLVALNELDYKNVSFGSGLTCTIKLAGDKWDGQLDANIAQILVSLQELIFDGYSVIMDLPLRDVKKLFADDLRITAVLQPGCSLFSIDFIKLAKKMVSNMTSQQTFICALVLILAVSGYMSYSKTLEHTERMELLNSNNTIASSALELANTVVQDKVFNRKSDKVGKSIYSAMDKDDEITIESTGEVLTKKQFRPRYPKMDVEVQIKYLDGEYKFFQMNTKNNIKVIIADKNGQEIRADLMLSPDDITMLTERLLDHEFVSVQINAKIDDNGDITEANIISLGAPRDTAVSISDL